MSRAGAKDQLRHAQRREANAPEPSAVFEPAGEEEITLESVYRAACEDDEGLRDVPFDGTYTTPTGGHPAGSEREDMGHELKTQHEAVAHAMAQLQRLLADSPAERNAHTGEPLRVLPWEESAQMYIQGAAYAFSVQARPIQVVVPTDEREGQ